MKTFNEWAEADRIVKQWEATHLLRGCKNPVETALALEGQRLHNEAVQDTNDVAAFKRISIPLIRRIFGHFGGEETGGCKGIDCPINKPILGSIRPLGEWHTFEDISMYVPGDGMHNLDYEAEYCAETAKRLAESLADLAGDKQIKIHCLDLEPMGMARCIKVNYSLS